MAAVGKWWRSEQLLAAALAPLARPALLLVDWFDRAEEGAFVYGATLRAAPVTEVPVPAPALILLGALRQRQSRRTAGQESLATQLYCRGAR